MKRLLMVWAMSVCLVLSFGTLSYASQSEGKGVDNPTEKAQQADAAGEKAALPASGGELADLEDESEANPHAKGEKAEANAKDTDETKAGQTKATNLEMNPVTKLAEDNAEQGKAPSATPSAAETPATKTAAPKSPVKVDAQAEQGAITKDGKRIPVKIAEKSILPLRVLTRPMSNLYKEPKEDSAIVQGNLPAFATYYVYTRPGGEMRDMDEGWYEVGTDNRGSIVGWLKTADIFEWKQTLCLSYKHPENRKPVLMFEGKNYLTSLVDEKPETRAEKVNGLYSTIEKGSLPADFQVVSVEPKRYIDITKEFYLLPILEHMEVPIDGREGRILKLASVAASGADARESSDIRKNMDYAKQAALSSGQASSGQIANMEFEIVWVIDTTVSMGPFIDMTRDMVMKTSQEITKKNKDIASKIRFGAWAYRDPVEAIPGIEYTTKNFTPTLQDIDTFVETVGTIKETKVDSIDFPEDVYSGLSDAILKTQWSPNTVRFIVLVGDAPGHELGHRFNASGYDDTTIRALADDKGISLIALQIRPKGAKKHQKVAEKQFKVLSLNKGADVPAYFDVQGSNKTAFMGTSELILGSIVSAMKEALEKGSLDTILESETPPVGTLTGEMATSQEGQGAPAKGAAGEERKLSDAETGLGQSIKAALVQWVGSSTGAKPPRDIVAWITDKDLVDTNVQSMEVRMLINKNQLDTLANLLKDVIGAGRLGQVSGEDFFTSLQSASAVAARDPNMLKNAKSLAKSGLIPSFLEGLPYHSRLMDMSNELWNSWSPDEQDNFLNELDARVTAYQAIHDDPQGWVKLNPGDDADESVYPMLLNLLP